MFSWFRRKKTKDNAKAESLPLSNTDRQMLMIEEFKPEEAEMIKKALSQGDLRGLDTLFRSMRANWPRLRKNMDEVIDKVTLMELDVLPWAEKGQEPSAKAQEMAALVESVYLKALPDPRRWKLGFTDVRKILAESYLRGASCLEIEWTLSKGSRYPLSYTPIPSTFYCWNNETGGEDKLVFCPEGVDGGAQVDFTADKFLISLNKGSMDHPVYGAKLIPLVGSYIGFKYGWRYFMNYCQLFGIPWRHIKAETEEDRKEALKDMMNYGSSGVIATHPDTTIELFAPSTSGQSLPQRELVELANMACDNLILGQELTSSTGKSGSRALGEVQNEVRKENFAGVAQHVLRVLNEQLIPAIIRLNYGELPGEGLPYFAYKTDNTEQEAMMLDKIERMRKIGISLANEYVYDSLGVPIPKEGEELFASPSLSVDPASSDDKKEKESTPKEEKKGDEEKKKSPLSASVPVIDDIDKELSEEEQKKKP